MTAADKGTAIVVDAGGYILTGGTATLLAAPGQNPNTIGAGIRLSPMVISSDGLTAVYTTTGTDFLEGGPWMLQLNLSTAAGEVFSSAPAPIYVNPLL